MEGNFWDELKDLLEDMEADDLDERLLKILNYCVEIVRQKKTEEANETFQNNLGNVLSATEFLNDFLTTHDFKQDFLKIIISVIPDFVNIYILDALNNTIEQDFSQLQDSVQIAEKHKR